MINNDFDLLELMLEEQGKQENIWQPTSYWLPYAEHISAVLFRSGLSDFRDDYNIIKGYGDTSIAKPSNIEINIKLKIFDYIIKLPLLRKVDAFYQRAISNEAKKFRRYYNKYCHLLTYTLSLGEKSRDVLNETYDSLIGTRQFISFDNKKVTRKYL